MFEATTRPEPGAAHGDARPLDRRVLVLAPFGRDAAEIGRVLGESGLDARCCASVDELCAEIGRGAAAGLLAEEALSDEARRRIADVLAGQPAWSDFPLLVMTSRHRAGRGGWDALRTFERTAHLTLLERPLRAAGLVSAVRAALASRERQYQVRDELAAREAAEVKLQESEWRLRRLVEGNIIGVVTANLERIVEANDVFLSMIGATRGDLERDGIDWSHLTPPEHRPKDEEALCQMRSDGTCKPFEKEYFRKDGSRVPILIAGTVVKREPLTWMCFILDLSEMKRTEEALKRLNETLEQRVAERTAVAERRARDLRRLAAQLSEAEHRERERLARLLHDDLQQMLLAVKLRLPVLIGAEPDRLRQHVEKLEALVAQCLGRSRDFSHELSPPVLRHGSLAKIVEWLAKWFGEKHGLSVTVEARDEPPEVPEHVRVFLFQAVRELLTNVMKHSGSMEARGTLSCRGANLTVQVEDGGTGFDARAVETRLQRPEGFGLFNIRERLEALGGRLETAATPQGGACFRLVLPVAEDVQSPFEVAEPEGGSMTASDAGESHSEDGVVRLLVADDHAMVREGLVGLLNIQPGLEVAGEAADGQEAVEQAEALRPDAIIMDADMPNVNGIEASRQIKARHPEIVIVGLSLHEGPRVVRAMTEAGADAFVSKHGAGRDIVRAVRRLCGREGRECEDA